VFVNILSLQEGTSSFEFKQITAATFSLSFKELKFRGIINLEFMRE